MPPSLLGWVAGAGLTLLTGATRGEELAPPSSPLALTWSAPADCPTTAEVEAEVFAILGDEPAPEPVLEATALVGMGASGRWSAKLHTRRALVEGERELDGDDCAAVAHATALVLALALAPSPPPQEAAAAPAPAPPPPPPPLASRHRPVGLVRSSLLLGAGALPGLDAGAGLHVGYAGSSIAAELRLAAWLPRTELSEVEPGMGADFWALGATPTACVRWRPESRRFRLDSCAGVGLVRVHARGFGMAVPTTTAATWGVGRVEEGIALSLAEGVALRLSGELFLPFSRPRFAIENAGALFRPSELGGAAGLAAELGF